MRYAPEKYCYTDPDTGVQVTRLTGWRANSNHLYFTNNCFYENGKKIVFESDRENAHNLFSMDLETGIIDQLTDFPVLPYPRGYGFLESFVDPVQENCCFFCREYLIYPECQNEGITADLPDAEGLFSSYFLHYCGRQVCSDFHL